jgi:hypothetical protein
VEESGPQTHTFKVAGRAVVVCSLMLIVIGVIARAFHFLYGRSLWLDEALLSLNICSRGFTGLLKPLGDNQAAPVGFLWIERACVDLFGTSERALRIPAIVSSLLLIPIFFRFARQRLGSSTAWIATGILSVLPGLIYYSAEAKQYPIDVLVCFALLASAATIAQRLPGSSWPWTSYTALCAGGLWMSHPSLFFAAGTWVVLAAISYRHGYREMRHWLAIVAASTILSFSVCYLTSLRFTYTNPFLRDFWSSAYIDVPPRSLGDIRQYITCFLSYFEMMFSDYLLKSSTGPRLGTYAAVLAVLGAVRLFKTDTRLCCFILLPLCLGVFAGAIHMYPLQGRLTLYAAAPLTLLISYAVAYYFKEGMEPAAVGWIFYAGLILLPVMECGAILQQRPQREEVRACMEVLRHEARPNDSVYIYGESQAPVEFYRTYRAAFSLPGIRFVEGGAAADEKQRWPETEISRVSGRVWFIFSHVQERTIGNEEDLLVNQLYQHGEALVPPRRFYGATLYLFNLPSGRFIDRAHMKPSLSSLPGS